MGLSSGNRVEGGFACPSFADGATTVGRDESDGDLGEFLMEFASEEVSDRREGGDGFGEQMTHAPFTDFGELGSSRLLLRIQSRSQFQLHVGLAGADPHFTDQDVLNGKRVFASELDLVGAIAGWKLELEFPFALRIRGGFRLLEPNWTETFSPGSAQPHRTADFPAWMAMWPVRMAGRRTSGMAGGSVLRSRTMGRDRSKRFMFFENS
jgi:hypothetical protein